MVQAIFVFYTQDMRKYLSKVRLSIGTIQRTPKNTPVMSLNVFIKIKPKKIPNMKHDWSNDDRENPVFWKGWKGLCQRILDQLNLISTWTNNETVNPELYWEK